MKTRLIFYFTLTLFLSGLLLIQTADAMPKNGTLRVSGDNTWVAFVDGEEVAASGNWQAPTVSEFKLDKGFAQIAVYVHDADRVLLVGVDSSLTLFLMISLITSERVKTVGAVIPVNCSTTEMTAGKRLISTIAIGKTNSKFMRNSVQGSGASVLHRCVQFLKTRIVKRIGYGAVLTTVKTISISDTPSGHFPSNLRTNSPRHGHVLREKKM